MSSNSVASTPTSIPRTHNSFASPLFTPTSSTTTPSVAVVAPPPTVASLHPTQSHPNANPFSAESLFQSSKGECAANIFNLVRREC